MMGRAIVIEILDLDMTYQPTGGKPVRALDGVNMKVARGEFISLIGPSGCGKSTLLKIVAGLYRRTSGVVSIDGRQVTGPSRDIGMVFQGPVLLPWRTVLQNVLLPVEVRHLDANSYHERALVLLATMGLEDFRDSYPYQLSGGMQQRVSIARALIQDPAILLMDEPFAALDAMTRESMNLELLRIWSGSGKTVIFVTHSISEAVFLSTRVAVMSSRPGRVLDIVDVDLPMPRTLDVMAAPEFGRLAVYLRARLEGGAGHAPTPAAVERAEARS